MADKVILHDKEFEQFISKRDIQAAVRSLSDRITKDYEGQKPVFLIVLNGAFMFAADLLKRIRFDCEIAFVKVKSYNGTQSTGTIHQVLGLDIPLQGRSVLLVEDIIDTGLTLDNLRSQVLEMGASNVKIVSCLLKPSAFSKNYAIDYLCFSIPNEFVVGYGLDYDGLGRNYPEVYKIV
jgi:hypoxanthine phosphoribosyltransferase